MPGASGGRAGPVLGNRRAVRHHAIGGPGFRSSGIAGLEIRDGSRSDSTPRASSRRAWRPKCCGRSRGRRSKSDRDGPGGPLHDGGSTPRQRGLSSAAGERAHATIRVRRPRRDVPRRQPPADGDAAFVRLRRRRRRCFSGRVSGSADSSATSRRVSATRTATFASRLGSARTRCRRPSSWPEALSASEAVAAPFVTSPTSRRSRGS